MNRQRYWKDSWLVTLAPRPGPCQTPHHSLADLRTGAPPTAEQGLQAWQAPRDPQSPVFSHTLHWERPVWASLGAVGSPDAKWICLFYALCCLRYYPSGAQLLWKSRYYVLASHWNSYLTGAAISCPGSLWSTQEPGTSVVCHPPSSRIQLQLWALLFPELETFLLLVWVIAAIIT